MPRRAETSATAELTAPRFAWLWAASVYALSALALAYPALSGQFLVNPRSDQYIAGFAFRDFAAQSLRAGHGFPMWNPYLFGGLPYVAAMHGDIFYPTFLLRMLLPTDQGMTWGFAVHLFLAGMFTYGFLRACRMSFFPSLVGGVAYMLSGQLAGLASPGHDGKLFVSALLPLVLWALVRGIRDGRRAAWGGLALAVGLGILSPHPQLFQYMLLTAGSFALYLAFANHEVTGQLARDVAIKRLALALGAVLLGVCIGGIQFLPVSEYVPWSMRAGGKGYEYATTYSFPIEELLNSYLPQFSGILTKYWGRNLIHLHSEYLGVVVLMLAGGAIGLTRERGFRRFWLGTLVIGVLWALGGSTPFYHLIYELVPGTKYFRAPSTIYFVYAFAVAIFAAFGTERLLAGKMSIKYGLIWLAGAGVVAIFMSAGGATVLSDMVINSLPSSMSGYETGMVSRAADNVPDVVIGGWRSFFFVAAMAGLIWAMSTKRVSRLACAWALVALTAVDLWSIERLYWQFSPPASVLYASDPALDIVKKQDQPGRVLALPLTDDVAPHDPNLEGDGLMANGIRSVTGYHGNELARYETLLANTSDISVMFNPEIWRQENIQYLYTNLPDSVMPQLQAQLHLTAPLVKLAGPVKDAAGSTVYLYRLPGENPYSWVAPVAVSANDDQAHTLVANASFDPTRAAIVDSSSSVKTAPITELPPPLRITTHVARYEPGKIAIDLSEVSPQGAMLILSENYYPGWEATANGQPLTVTRADYNLVGIQLPAGAQHVDVTFDDRAVDRGRTVTLVALSLALAWFVGGLVVDRQGRGPATPATA